MKYVLLPVAFVMTACVLAIVRFSEAWAEAFETCAKWFEARRK